MTLRQALSELEIRGISIRSVSRFYRTPAFPPGSGPEFVNAAAMLEGPQDPDEVLAILHDVEDALGRKRAARWGARTLDLDLIAMADMVCPDPATHQKWREMPLEAQQRDTPDQLILPHPRVQDRAFVLVPLCDIAPEWRHPLLGLTARQLLESLPEAQKNEVTALD